MSPGRLTRRQLEGEVVVLGSMGRCGARPRTSAAVLLLGLALAGSAGCNDLSGLAGGAGDAAGEAAEGDGAAGDAPEDTVDAGLDATQLDGASASLAAGGFHACTIRNGAVYCWGSDSQKQLGPTSCEAGSCTTPQRVVLLDGAAGPVEVAGGYIHTCARLADNTAQCWGDNVFGELGLGPLPPTTVLGLVATNAPLAEVALGDNDSCAVGFDGTLLCWGSNASGQLGTGDTTSHGAPVTVPNLVAVEEVGLGTSWTCARLGDGGVDCWGNNGNTIQPCDAGAVCSPEPVPILGLDGVDGGAVRLAVGSTFACALMADATVRCWGHNASGELGDGTMQSRAAAVAVQYVTNNGPLQGVVDLSAGGGGNCAVLGDGGGVACWGTTPFAPTSPLAALVPSLTSVEHVALGSNGQFACVLFQDGGVSCIGDNASGELGGSDCDSGSSCPLAPVVGLP
jgi:alpha-tubulin suppressor-like RCC1 family protein